MTPIKENTLYKLRNGWRVGLLCQGDDGFWHEGKRLGDIITSVRWSDYGTALGEFPGASANAFDIVAEWPTQPNFEAAIGVAEAKLDETAPDIEETIADEAKRIVAGARRGAYGKPEQNFERIARFWQAYFENTGRPEAKITAADVSPMLRLMKEARLCETPDHYDSHVDLVGYALTGAEVNKVKKPS